MDRARSGPQAALIGFAVRFRGVVIVFACVLLGYGFYALRDARYEMFFPNLPRRR